MRILPNTYAAVCSTTGLWFVRGCGFIGAKLTDATILDAGALAFVRATYDGPVTVVALCD